MNKYTLEIKSRIDAPNLFYEAEADTLDEAVNILYDQLHQEYDKEWLKNNIEEFKLCERCGGEVGAKTLEDEYYDFCYDCYSVNN